MSGSRASTYVYAVAGEGMPYVKIGVTGNPDARVRQLQTGNPHHLYLARRWGPFTSRMAGRIEMGLHYIFSDFRMKGEWFCVSVDEVAQYVATASSANAEELAILNRGFLGLVIGK